jgi:hypothetical protein
MSCPPASIESRPKPPASPPGQGSPAAPPDDQETEPSSARRNALLALFGLVGGAALMSKPAQATYPVFDASALTQLLDQVSSLSSILSVITDVNGAMQMLTSAFGPAGPVVEWAMSGNPSTTITWADGQQDYYQAYDTMSNDSRQSGVGLISDTIYGARNAAGQLIGDVQGTIAQTIGGPLQVVGGVVGTVNQVMNLPNQVMYSLSSLIQGLNPLNLLGAGTGQSMLRFACQPMFDGLDRIPDAYMLSNPADARLYSRSTFSYSAYGLGSTYGWQNLGVDDRRRIEDRCQVEVANAAYDGHGTALFEAQAAARAGDRVRTLGGALSSANTLREQEYANGRVLLAILEEMAGTRASLAALVRLQAAERMSSQRMVDRQPPNATGLFQNGALEDPASPARVLVDASGRPMGSSAHARGPGDAWGWSREGWAGRPDQPSALRPSQPSDSAAAAARRLARHTQKVVTPTDYA